LEIRLVSWETTMGDVLATWRVRKRREKRR
jgi:hypothetical protein